MKEGIPGWKLREGSLNYGKVSENQLWAVVNKTFSSQSKKTTSYKFGLIRAILESLYDVEVDLTISFEKLSESLATLYWNLIVKHEYSQGNRARIQTVLETIKNKHQVPNEIPYDNLSPAIKQEVNRTIQNELLNRYVVGALYSDTEGFIYGFSIREKTIRLNASAYEFLLKFQEVLFRLNNYELTKFIQSKNKQHSKEIIIENIENITKRESLFDYKEILLKHTEPRCFYTNVSLQTDYSRISVDHFIPWSFIHSDNLWNFVLTTSSVNSRKSSKLPTEDYLKKLFIRNESLKKVSDQDVRNEFSRYQESTISKLYNYAEINGFQTGWSP